MVVRILVDHNIAGLWDHVSIGVVSGAFVRLMPSSQCQPEGAGSPIEIEGTRLEVILALRMGLADQHREVCAILEKNGVILTPTALEWEYASTVMRTRIAPPPWRSGDVVRISDGTRMDEGARCDVAIMVGGRWVIIVTNPTGGWGGMLCEDSNISVEQHLRGSVWWADNDRYRLLSDDHGHYLRLIETEEGS